MSLSASNYDQIIGLALKFMVKGDDNMGNYAQYLQTTLNGSDVGSLETTSEGLTYYVNADIGQENPAKIQFDKDGSGGISAEINGAFFQVGKSSSSYSQITDTSTQGAYFRSGSCQGKVLSNNLSSSVEVSCGPGTAKMQYENFDYGITISTGPLTHSKFYDSSEGVGRESLLVAGKGLSQAFDQGDNSSSFSAQPSNTNYLLINRTSDSYKLDINYARGQIKHTDDFTDDTYSSAKFSIYNPSFSFDLSNKILKFSDNRRSIDAFSVIFGTDEDNYSTGTIDFNVCGSLTMKRDTSTGEQNLYFNGKKVLLEESSSS